MIFECPVCKSTLLHRRTDDGTITNSISRDGEATEIGNRSNGSDDIYCSADSNHDIPQDLAEAVLDVV